MAKTSGRPAKRPKRSRAAATARVGPAIDTGPEGQGSRPFSDEQFIKALQLHFPTLYFHLVSIIQGVALAALAYGIVNSLGEGHGRELLALYLANFTAIVLVTFEYFWYVPFRLWAPTEFDVILPLALGMAEFFPTFYFARLHNWMMAMALLGVIGLCTYGYFLVELFGWSFLFDRINKSSLRARLINHYRLSLALIGSGTVLYGLYAANFLLGWKWFTQDIMGLQAVTLAGVVATLVQGTILVHSARTVMSRGIRHTMWRRLVAQWSSG